MTQTYYPAGMNKESFSDFYRQMDPVLKDYRERIKRTESDFIPSVIREMRKGYSPIILVCGRPRSGKSHAGLTLASIFSTLHFYKWYNYKAQFFFFPKDLIKAMDDTGGQIMVLDEAGASLNKRAWQSDFSFAFDKVLQTQGFLQNTYIFILPFASDLVKDCRKYVDYVIKTQKRGTLKIRKVIKKEDQMVSDLKAFGSVYIEHLKIRKTDIPAPLWQQFEIDSRKIKNMIRQNIINEMSEKESDWLGGF